MKSYNIVEDLEESWSNITFAQLLQDPKQVKLLKDALRWKEHQEIEDNWLHSEETIQILNEEDD